MVEYTLLAFLLALAILTGGATAGTALQNAFSTVSQSLEQATVPYTPSPDACGQVAQGHIAHPDRKLGRTQE